MDYGIWSRILEPPVHKTLPEEFSIRLFRKNSSSRLFWKNSSSRLFRKNSSSRLVDSYGRTQLMFYLKHAVPSHSSSLLTVTVRTLSYIWHSKWDMLHVTCYMQSVMCYMWLVTCYVKALLSMGKQGTKSFARDFLITLYLTYLLVLSSLSSPPSKLCVCVCWRFFQLFK